ncbi:hypothetical protein HMPREF9080_00279 [Cardiobacterium valvarum F0432]|uniref:Uncharacterized protein n=1 Tax=Cardiobacterium valvarum F0432 TaxID=797473 RepID=G9ZC02_9GAMM|nr:hypothetical protein HMPREF9080_00279 [Cardiobacterium valvarum F0432]
MALPDNDLSRSDNIGRRYYTYNDVPVLRHPELGRGRVIPPACSRRILF